MKKLVYLLGILLALSGSVIIASGDIAIEGVRNYDYQYEIENAANYTDWLFVTSSEIWGFEYPELVINGTFGGGYKLDGFVLHAVNNSSIDATIRDALMGNETEEVNLTGFFDNTQMATSDLSLPVSAALEEDLMIENISVSLIIQDITAENLNMTMKTVKYGYLDGFVEELPVEDNYVPEPGTLSS